MAFNDIRAISFDADGTLFDFQSVMRLALGDVLIQLQRLFPNEAAGLSIDTLKQHRDEAALALSGSNQRMEEIRLDGFKRTLSFIGVDDDRLAADLTDHFLECRFAKIVAYEDVLPALQRLGEHFKLGVLSNGNSYPERCGLKGWFSFEVYAHDHGVEKPDVRLFEIMVNQTGYVPSQILHVGDSLRNDVIGAQQAGIKAVWLNRNGEQQRRNILPDFEVTSLCDLVGLCS